MRELLNIIGNEVFYDGYPVALINPGTAPASVEQRFRTFLLTAQNKIEDLHEKLADYDDQRSRYTVLDDEL